MLTVFTKRSIIDLQLSSKHACDKLSFSSYSKFMAFLRIAIFRPFVKEALTLLRHYIENQKMISETIITDTVKRAFKELLKDSVLRSQEKYSK